QWGFFVFRKEECAMKAHGQIKKFSKKEAEHAKRQARARRQLEIMQELKGIGLNPYLDAKLITQ
ncbi:hypothetical protein, partial [Vibrio parahaemolyticus]|uniref:hypothetical protein n=2 Tax=Vibrio parahaemolyticus TaxID=670 RepID=UPI001C5E8E81